MSGERVDVILPCRNAPAVLGLCLTHLWQYGREWVRFVVVLDNASTDPGMGPVLAAAARQPGHLVIRHERNVGVWCSVNRGLATVTGDRVLVLTSDVLLGPQTLPVLLEAQRQSAAVCIGPEPSNAGLATYPSLFDPRTTYGVQAGHNGALWLLDWPAVRDAVGWYDSRFYVCNGDTDMLERLLAHAERTQDARFVPRIVRGLPTCHLDKQSRRADHTAEADAAVSVRDSERFQAKWDGTAAAVRHPQERFEDVLAFIQQEHGGWDSAKVGASDA